MRLACPSNCEARTMLILSGQVRSVSNCPAPSELLLSALGLSDALHGDGISLHVEHCIDCREKVSRIRSLAQELHAMPDAMRTEDCLDEAALVALAWGDAGNRASTSIDHVAGCAHCRRRLSDIVRLAADPTIKQEIDALEPPRRIPTHRFTRRTLVFGTLAAAAAVAVLISPFQSMKNRELRREAANSSAIAPRIVSPAEIRNRNEPMRWTSVPHADLYRVRIWNQNGDVVWSTETTDTVVSVPSVIQSGVRYMWVVDARTAWDRWVSSDLVELQIQKTPSH